MLALRFFTPLRFVQNDMVGAASMDSRLRGNDGKHPPLLCRFFGLREGGVRPPPFAERKGVRGMLQPHTAPCIPRSHRFAPSRPLTQAKGA